MNEQTHAEAGGSTEPIAPDVPAADPGPGDDDGPRGAYAPERERTLAALTADREDGDERELSDAERLYVDHAAGRLTDGQALRSLLALAAGCDDDVYADERQDG